MKLSIIIPAYNEEQSIGSTIQRTLEARSGIMKKTGVNDVEVIVVDDGSKDNTKNAAQAYSKDIILVSYKKNKGYGAAIKEGFKTANGDILSFLDADGTCDPALFTDLVNILLKNNADIAIGSRLGPKSKMPKIRRFGNNIYAKIINFFGNVKITDCASGMRVIRKTALDKLYPLPDGMHFTPAMTCKALMGKGLKIAEAPIEYAEREGKSKLSVIKDGQQFLKTILGIAFFYKPLKFFMTIAIFLFIIATAYFLNPFIYYILNHRIEDRFIYRLVTIMVLTVAGLNFAILGLLADQIVALLNEKKERMSIRPGYFIGAGAISIFAGILLNIKTIIEYITMGRIYTHWIYVLTGALFVLLGVGIFGYGFLQKLLTMYKTDKCYNKNEAGMK